MRVAVRASAAGGRAAASFVQAGGAAPANFSATGSADAALRCPELDCVRALLPADLLEQAAERAMAHGVGADRVLIAAGTLTEDVYLRALADSVGVAFEPLDDMPRASCPLTDERLIESAAAGMLPLSIDNELSLVVAPRGTAARRILRLIEQNPARARHFRFTNAERLNRFMLRHADRALATRASRLLKRKWPILSNAPPRRRASAWAVAAVTLLAIATVALAPASMMLAGEVALAAVFLAWLGLRLAGAFVASLMHTSAPELPDDELPVYTVIAALYREATSVDGLLRAIERLDYPPEKLDVAVEADDDDTRASIAARKIRMPITVVPVPAGGPRTKPKALNVALPFARGTFTVIYDAEDRPEPGQLRRALQAFRAGDDHLACVQAPLCIDNGADSWLAHGIMAQTPQDLAFAP